MIAAPDPCQSAKNWSFIKSGWESACLLSLPFLWQLMGPWAFLRWTAPSQERPGTWVVWRGIVLLCFLTSPLCFPLAPKLWSCKNGSLEMYSYYLSRIVEKGKAPCRTAELPESRREVPTSPADPQSDIPESNFMAFPLRREWCMWSTGQRSRLAWGHASLIIRRSFQNLAWI